MSKPEKSLEYCQEMLSALFDGELVIEEAEVLFQSFEYFPELKQQWFHLQKIRQGVQGELFSMPKQEFEFVNSVSAIVAGISFDKADVVNLADRNIPEQRTEKKPMPQFQAFAIAASVMLVVVFTFFASDGSQFRLDSMLAFNSGVENQVMEAAELPGELFIDTKKSAQIASQRYGVRVSSDSGVAVPGQLQREHEIYLSSKRVQDYMLFHAESASLNSNKGMLPFARMSRVAESNQF